MHRRLVNCGLVRFVNGRLVNFELVHGQLVNYELVNYELVNHEFINGALSNRGIYYVLIDSVLLEVFRLGSVQENLSSSVSQVGQCVFTFSL